MEWTQRPLDLLVLGAATRWRSPQPGEDQPRPLSLGGVPRGRAGGERDYAALSGRRWDAVIDDSASVATWIEGSSAQGDASGRCLFMSPLSAPSHNSTVGMAKDGPVLPREAYRESVASDPGSSCLPSRESGFYGRIKASISFGGPVHFFSQPWMQSWRDEINRDPEYASVGRGWTGPVLLRSRDSDGGVRAAYLDLAAGVCREARVGTADDESDARIVIGADRSDWERVLSGEVDPVLGLLRGVLALEKGTVLSMVPHQASARALLKAAVRVEAGAAVAENRHEPPDPPPPHREFFQPVHPGPRVFQTLSDRGLNHDAFPMVLYHKAKKLGVWDPRDIDLTQDRRDWVALAPEEQDLLLRLSTFFQAGEEAVARDLLPLIHVISREGRLEEEMYLTTFLFEEAKHVEVFRRFLDEVAPDHGNLRRFESASYRIVFEDELPTALFALIGDASPRAQVRAAVTYNVIVEGVLAETGYRGYQQVLHSRGILPGMQEAVHLLKRDESRHIAYGLYLISRLVAEHGDVLWTAVEDDLARLLSPALGVVEEIFQPYEVIPFGLNPPDFTSYAVQQFQARLRRLDQARRSGRLVDEVV